MDIIRHVNVIDPSDCKLPVHIVGAGATGSWVTLMLSKLGFDNVNVYDFDEVESHNLPNQCFRHSDVGTNKARAIESICKDFGAEVKGIDEKVTGENMGGIVVVLTDTMDSRSEIFNNIALKHRAKFYVETRMDYNNGRVYSVDPTDIKSVKRYQETLYSDKDAETASGPSACGASQTVIGTSVYIASLVIWRIINYVNGVKNPFEMLFDVENCLDINED